MTDETPEQTPRLHRRVMAYVALLALCAMALGAFVRELHAPNADLLTALAYALAAIVLAYLGAQIAPDVFRRK
jgi:hypothetical protein